MHVFNVTWDKMWEACLRCEGDTTSPGGALPTGDPKRAQATLVIQAGVLQRHYHENEGRQPVAFRRKHPESLLLKAEFEFLSANWNFGKLTLTSVVCLASHPESLL